MSDLNMSIPHQLPEAEALKRIKTLLQQMRQQYGSTINNLQEQWSENVGTFSFDAMGFRVSGTLAVTPNDVKLHGTLPFAASFFQGKIEQTIRERAAELLA